MNRECSPKEQAIYDAVFALFWEGTDLNELTVAEITRKAGIGKGTAYEYFSDKEEMIAKALFYHTSKFCSRVYERAKSEEDLSHKIMKILLCMEQEVGETSCIIRLIHTLTDNSLVGKKLKELIESKAADEIMVEDVMRLMILESYPEATISGETLFYLVTSSISRIFCYGMILNSSCHEGEYRKDVVREMVCASICREIEELVD